MTLFASRALGRFLRTFLDQVYVSNSLLAADFFVARISQFVPACFCLAQYRQTAQPANA